MPVVMTTEQAMSDLISTLLDENGAIRRVKSTFCLLLLFYTKHHPDVLEY